MKVLAFIAVAGFICQANCLSFETKEGKDEPGDVICTDCKVLFTDIKNLLQSEESKNTTTAGVTNLICGMESDSPLYRFCSSLVSAFVSPILQLVAEEVEPEEVCVYMSLCRPEGIYQEFKYDMRLLRHFVKKVEKKIKKDLKKYDIYY